jgi:molybdenum cofactor guanylyltransferase
MLLWPPSLPRAKAKFRPFKPFFSPSWGAQKGRQHSKDPLARNLILLAPARACLANKPLHSHDNRAAPEMKQPPVKSTSVEICILAGGLSTRMGRDKARVRLGRGTMLAQVVRIAHAVGRQVRVIRRDLLTGRGPVGGVHTALETTPCDAVLFLSCDMPFVPLSILMRVLDQSASPTRASFVEVNGRIGFPFLVNRTALELVRELLHENQASLHELAKRLQAHRILASMGEIPLLLNVNSTEDLQLAQSLLTRQRKEQNVLQQRRSADPRNQKNDTVK